MKKITFLILTLFFFITIVWVGCKKEELPEIEQWTPQNFWASDTISFGKFLTWDYYGPDFIDGFKIDRKFGNSDWEIDIAVLNSSARSWIDTNLRPDPNQTYEYRIYAYRGNEQSKTQNITTRVFIEPPSKLSIEMVSNSSCKISWEDNCRYEDGYVIDKKTGSEAWVENYAQTQANRTTFIDTNLYRSNNVAYRVYTKVGNYLSAKDSIAIATNHAIPENPVQNRQTIDQFNFSWSYNSNTVVDGFRIKRKYPGQEWEMLAEISEQTFIDNSFEMDMEIEYGVFAYIGKIESNPLMFYLNSKIPTPENISYTINSPNSVSAFWELDIDGLDDYILERINPSGSWEQVATAPGDAQSMVDNNANLQACLNFKLYYRIKATYNGYFSNSDTLDLKNGAFQDERDGEIYETVVIGDQCWLQRNLAWLPEVCPPESGSNEEPFYYVYDYFGDNVQEAKATQKYKDYGAIYNWPAAMNACPENWHLPSDNEWQELANYVGGMNVAGWRLRISGRDFWAFDSENSPTPPDDYQFSAVGAGARDDGSNGYYFYGVTWYTYWWANNSNQNTASKYYIAYYYNNLHNENEQKSTGLPVRCIKD
jgi:uncharacterized protein (TIGR02145 family)